LRKVRKKRETFVIWAKKENRGLPSKKSPFKRKKNQGWDGVRGLPARGEKVGGRPNRPRR